MPSWEIGRALRPRGRSRRLLQTLTPGAFLAAGLAALGIPVDAALLIGVELWAVTATVLVLKTLAGRQTDSDRHR